MQTTTETESYRANPSPRKSRSTAFGRGCKAKLSCSGPTAITPPKGGGAFGALPPAASGGRFASARATAPANSKALGKKGPYPFCLRRGRVPPPRGDVASASARSAVTPIAAHRRLRLLRGLASALGASAPYKHTRASALSASARIALGPRGASCSEDSPSHRRRGRRLLRLDMRTLAHVCAPRLTWSASERPRSPRGPERAALRL